MKLKLILLVMCLFATGLFADAQGKKRKVPPPVVVNGPDAIPIVVKSTKKGHLRKVAPVKRVKKPAGPKPLGVAPVRVEKLLQVVRA